jgi:DNA-3-methyladenine glycosylase
MAINRGLAANAPAANLTGGPGRLCRALNITRPEHNGLDLLDPKSPLQLRQDDWIPSPIEVTPRIGIRHAADLPLRFALTGNACVSRLRPSRNAV